MASDMMCGMKRFTAANRIGVQSTSEIKDGFEFALKATSRRKDWPFEGNLSVTDMVNAMAIWFIEQDGQAQRDFALAAIKRLERYLQVDEDVLVPQSVQVAGPLPESSAPPNEMGQIPPRRRRKKSN